MYHRLPAGPSLDCVAGLQPALLPIEVPRPQFNWNEPQGSHHPGIKRCLTPPFFKQAPRSQAFPPMLSGSGNRLPWATALPREHRLTFVTLCERSQLQAINYHNGVFLSIGCDSPPRSPSPHLNRSSIEGILLNEMNGVRVSDSIRGPGRDGEGAWRRVPDPDS